MCHLVLLMPVIALPLFWIAPMGFAVPGYLFVLVLSIFVYWLITRAMKQPVRDGFQSLIGTEASVISRVDSEHAARYLVRSQGELWSAFSKDELQPGDGVIIVGVRGVGVVIERSGTPEAKASQGLPG